MGIELQSAPHGHHKVSGAQGHANKAGDTSQPDSAFGFAALMNLMSCSDSDLASVPDTSGTVLQSPGLDGALAGLESNVPVAAVQASDSAVFVLPIGTQPAAISTPQFERHSANFLANQVSVLRTTQPGIDLPANAPVDSSETSTSPGVGQPAGGLQPSVGALDASDIVGLPSQTLPLPVGTVTEAAPALSSVVARGAQTEAQPKGFQADPKGMRLMDNPAPPSTVGQVQLDQSKAELDRATGLSVIAAPAAQVDAKLPFPMPLQTGQNTVMAPHVAAIPSKAGAAVEQGVESLAPIGQAQTLMVAQTSPQTIVPVSSEQLAQPATLKSAGLWTSQQSTLAGQLRQDSGDLTKLVSSAAGFGPASSAVPTLMLNPQEAGIRLADRPAKHQSNRFGSGGEGVYGQPMATINPADALFQVVPTSAAAASTVVAETVSYWASQGIHNASLQLEGFGDEPVEVRISVSGDMAQVDFRTNQPEVRQAIEGAASQLKDLLSSQGVQLGGLSIGTSARGGAQDKSPRPPSDTRKITLIKSDVVDPMRARGANPSVGQSLDLFV